jgi:hypothetical protein
VFWRIKRESKANNFNEMLCGGAFPAFVKRTQMNLTLAGTEFVRKKIHYHTRKTAESPFCGFKVSAKNSNTFFLAQQV